MKYVQKMTGNLIWEQLPKHFTYKSYKTLIHASQLFLITMTILIWFYFRVLRNDGLS